MGSSKRRSYSREFKERAVALLESREESAEKIGDELGIRGDLIRRWQKALKACNEDGLPAFPGQGIPRDEELFRLRKENADLKEANEILKKAAVIFATTRPR
jgi:transposase-like protein